MCNYHLILFLHAECHKILTAKNRLPNNSLTIIIIHGTIGRILLHCEQGENLL